MTNTEWGDEPHGSTPLAAEDFEGMIPTDVATRADLNAAERDNILAARAWAFTSTRITTNRLLEISTIDDIHRRMFNRVWTWAGKRRVKTTNIGVEPTQILTQMRDVVDDARYWHDHEAFAPNEIAVRLHHRLVHVHPYVNGNGRHARLVADLYLHVRGEPVLAWKPNESDPSASRDAYIAALRRADAGDYADLISYASG